MSIFGNIGEDRIKQMLDSMDEQQKAKMVFTFIEHEIAPHMEEIRTRSAAQPDPNVVREKFADLDDDAQDDWFYDALNELYAAVGALRSDNPQAGLHKLKEMARDPTYSEALLLIFDNDDHIDDEYIDTTKEFGATVMTNLGVLLFPEMYSAQERHEAEDRLGIEIVGPEDFE